MNEKTRVQIEEMKKQTIGVEVEMNNIDRSRAAKVAADFFGTGRSEDTAYRNGYSTWSAWDAQGREWKFQKDVSIEGPDSQKCELVTPILTYADMETLQELIRRLRKAGAKSDSSRGCGVHIHIGAKGHTPQTLRNLANIMASHESLLAEALNLDHYRMSRYCRTVDPRFLEQLNRRKPTTMADLADIWYGSQGANYGRSHHYNDSRYHMLNLHATFTKGTGRVPAFPIRCPCGRKAQRPARRSAEELYPALPGAQPDGQDGAHRQPPSLSRTKTPNTPCAPGSSALASSVRSSKPRETS